MATSPTARIPKYRRQKRQNCADAAFVQLDGQRVYLGRFGSPESREAYRRAVAEWAANDRALPVEPEALSVVELCARFWRHVQSYYRKPDGSQTHEAAQFRIALRVVRELYGSTPVADFGPRALKAIRKQLIERGGAAQKTEGRQPRGCSRTTVNKHVARIRMMFKWGVAEELVSPSVYQALSAVSGLRRGRTEARESEPVRPVPESYVEAIQEHVSRQVWALVQLQLLTGARGGELVIMRPIDLDTTGAVWAFTPSTHKTEHHGHGRTIYLGPKAQAIVAPFLAGRAVEAFVFSPREAEAERRAKLHAERTTPKSCGNRPGSNRVSKPTRAPGERYTPGSYRRAIQRACELAKVPSWHPHQLRHNAATRLRREFGIDLAQTILGHRLGSAITELYAEANVDKARKVISRVG